MSRSASGQAHGGGPPSLGDLLTARPSGLTEPESWAILCQAVQALQDLFLSDGASGERCLPLVTPSTLMLSSRGRVKLCQNSTLFGCGPPAHLTGYLAPEYRLNKHFTDTETEKMWIYALGETLKRATLKSSGSSSLRLSNQLCHVLSEMTKVQVAARASLMLLLEVISEYCKRRQQNRPFSHIVMDLHQEAMAAIEMTMDTPWGPPAMPELRPRTRNRCESNTDGLGTIPRRWINLTRNHDLMVPKLTKEASTSMENLSYQMQHQPSGALVRPKSMCVASDYYNKDFQFPSSRKFSENCLMLGGGNSDSGTTISSAGSHHQTSSTTHLKLMRNNNNINEETNHNNNNRRLRVRRNPVHRAASRLYKAHPDATTAADDNCSNLKVSMGGGGRCVGPEFVVRASLPHKQIIMADFKGGQMKKNVTVIMLNGQKLEVFCNPNSTTAGQLFETIIQKEHIEENFMLGLSALIAGDFVFLPSDTRICKAMQSSNLQSNSIATTTLTLFMRVRFFMPTLRGIRGQTARHLLYLQLRRSILEHQLPCSFSQLIELDGLALQCEFGDYNHREHGQRDYFLMEHYVPETMSCAVEDPNSLRQELIRSHMSKCGQSAEKAEQDFIILAQSLPHYGGHFYTATWMLKDNNHKDVWLYISAQGINLYERDKSASNCGPQLYEMFEWRTIQTLCYSKHYLCILPHARTMHSSKLKKYKLKMDHKKSYFTFRLASLHHQFFLRLRTEYTSLQSLSQQFGIPLKDMKNETNSLCKLEALTNPNYMSLDQATVNAQTEFKIDFRSSSKCSSNNNTTNDKKKKKMDYQQQHEYNDNIRCKRAKSVHDFMAMINDADGINEEYQNKENEHPAAPPSSYLNHSGLVLDSSYLAGLGGPPDKRRGVKMGTRMFGSTARVSRSMEAVNAAVPPSDDYLEEMSLESVSLHCSSTSISRSPTADCAPSNEAYILESSIKSSHNTFLLPNFQESLSETLLEKFDNISFAEERVLSTVTVRRDAKGSLGLQITEGSDGNVYVQSVILGGPAHLTGNILSGDQVVGVDGQSLLGMKYETALRLLTRTGDRVEFVLSRMTPSRGQTSKQALSGDQLKCKMDLSSMNESLMNNLKLETTMNKLKRMSYPNVDSLRHCDKLCSPIEKHITESCHDVSNLNKYGSGSDSVPYHKHIRYEIETENENVMLKKYLPQNHSSNSLGGVMSRNLSKSCTQIYSEAAAENKAIIVDMIPKTNFDKYRSLDRRCASKSGTGTKVEENGMELTNTIPPIALPRSLGLSRKWRGPVRYPVTPVKKTANNDVDSCNNFSNSDEEQVFI